MAIKINELIKEYRKSKKLTLEKLAELVGSSSGYLSEIENGKKKPGGDLLLSLQRELGFPLGLNATSINGVKPTNIAINGHSAHIDIHHVNDDNEEYNPPPVRLRGITFNVERNRKITESLATLNQEGYSESDYFRQIAGFDDVKFSALVKVMNMSTDECRKFLLGEK